jgi:hypothetical protein
MDNHGAKAIAVLEMLRQQVASGADGFVVIDRERAVALLTHIDNQADKCATRERSARQTGDAATLTNKAMQTRIRELEAKSESWYKFAREVGSALACWASSFPGGNTHIVAAAKRLAEGRNP